MSDNDTRIARGLLAVAVPAERVTRPLFGRHGFAGGALLLDWPAIVGSAVASHTLPLRIRFPPQERAGGTLVIKVASSAFAPELQHLEPLILQRINGHFGYNAVARLKLVHGPLPERQPLHPPPVATGTLPERVETIIAAVEDDGLRAALTRLGARIAGRR